MYCLALAAQKTGVVVHAVVMMSNHHHMVVTDVHGVLPTFLGEFHRTACKALNASQGQWGVLWSVGGLDRVQLMRDEDVLRKIAYVVANPVAEGLVELPSEWPGVLLWGEQRRVVQRPDDYFDALGDSPDHLELVVTKPGVVMAEWERRLEAEVAELVAAGHRSVQASGKPFLGRAGVLAASFVERAKSYEQRRGIVPRVAAICRDARIEALRWYRRFEAGYRSALKAWKSGDREAVFPAGTWWMRVHHGSRVSAVVDPL